VTGAVNRNCTSGRVKGIASFFPGTSHVSAMMMKSSALRPACIGSPANGTMADAPSGRGRPAGRRNTM
jgi:hypothetical protein